MIETQFFGSEEGSFPGKVGALDMPLPADLLAAVAQAEGGRLVIIAGAGCSCEEPTGLPLSRECALEAHRRLVQDNVLADGLCANPEDLSCVADTALHHLGTQRPVVERLPRTLFRNAEPNDGHLLAAAMMQEGAIRAIVTLNFDLAFSTALAQLGTQQVVTLTGPQDHGQMGATNLVYLHRNVEAAPDDWILSTEALDNAWQGQWEEVVATAMLAGPVTVFVGLGTPAAVLMESARRIRAAIPQGVTAYLVDPSEIGGSPFFPELQIEVENYIQLPWVEFARMLSARLLEEHRAATLRAATEVHTTEQLQHEEVGHLCAQLFALGLVESGRLRAYCLLERTAYYPHRTVDARYLANLLLGIALIERHGGCQARLDASGIVEFSKDGRRLGRLRIACARGLWGWLAVEAKLQEMNNAAPLLLRTRTALVSGVARPPNEISAPSDITSDEAEDSIIPEHEGPTMVTIDELRENPDAVHRLFS